MKDRKVCIKARLPTTSLPLKGKVTKHTTVKIGYCVSREKIRRDSWILYWNIECLRANLYKLFVTVRGSETLAF